MPVAGRMILLLICLLCAAPSAPAWAEERDEWLELARRGWNYRLREPPLGRDMAIPVRISPQILSGSALCLVGEKPGRQTLEVLNGFRTLIDETFGKRLPMRYAGTSAQGCGSGRVVVLRLYSGFPPNGALTTDLEWLDTAYGLGLPSGRTYSAMSPAVAQAFFGRRGAAVHIMVQQAPPNREPTMLQASFYRSILIEELYQAFTFGADILVANRETAMQSKLQEIPVRMGILGWESAAFMQTLLAVTPGGLCRFDVFMLHAVAMAPVAETTDPALLDYIDAHFTELRTLAAGTLEDPRFGLLIDPACGQL